MLHKPVIFFFFLCFSFCARAQDGAGFNLPAGVVADTSSDKVNSDKVNNKRLVLVAGSTIALWSGSLLTLDKAWYNGYSRSSFHLFNDNKEWNQMDKLGHVWTTYHMSRLSTESWRWTGMTERKSIILGGISGLAFQSIIEVQDGFSTKWGFSTGDMAANVAGAAAFVVQELGWKEQRLQIKFSYRPYDYPAELVTRRNQLFGDGSIERILKDYNGQTYWLSGNIKSFFPDSRLPGWLNISLGYGSEGLYGGFENKWIDKTGAPHNRTDIARVRRFFIAPDVDLTNIKTHRKWLRAVFLTVNMIKFPAPALELNSKGKVKVHVVYF